MKPIKKQFWLTKALKEMTSSEWESLCDNCGRCCLHSVRDGKTGKIQFIAVSCRFLDLSTCHCKVYADRKQMDPDCINNSRPTPATVNMVSKFLELDDQEMNIPVS